MCGEDHKTEWLIYSVCFMYMMGRLNTFMTSMQPQMVVTQILAMILMVQYEVIVFLKTRNFQSRELPT